MPDTCPQTGPRTAHSKPNTMCIESIATREGDSASQFRRTVVVPAAAPDGEPCGEVKFSTQDFRWPARRS